MTDEQAAQITQLQQQQAIFTQALAAFLQGIYTGPGSVEGLVYALDPTIQGTLVLDLPIKESEAENIPKG